MESEIAQLFLSHSARQLEKMSGHIESCLDRLTDDQIWSRGAPHENSIGNLVLHLCGNVRQWIGSGVAGEKDVRDRPLEFSTTGGINADQLRSRLKDTVSHAVEIIRGSSPDRLLTEICPQNTPVSVLEAIYQAVGHFQLHTGQIIFATKILGGEDLGLYRP
jgi:hypothetical protein